MQLPFPSVVRPAPQIFAPSNIVHQTSANPLMNVAGGHFGWSLRFDGGPNSLDVEDLLFRFERQAWLCRVKDDALVIGFAELLKGRAEQWYLS